MQSLAHKLPCLSSAFWASKLSNVFVSARRSASAVAVPISIPHEPRINTTFRARDLEYNLTSTPKTTPPDVAGIPFGSVFTDHMFYAEFDCDRGWSHPTIRPCGPLSIHPAAQVLHYGLSCFEGMKAYYGVDGKIRLFRPEMNVERLKKSAQRLLLADFDAQEMLACLKDLLRVDKLWLPRAIGHSLYIRPFMFSNAAALGVSRSTRTVLSILLSPVGPYFASGLHPIRLFVEETRRRAWPGGVGEFKVGGNYAPTILPQVEAAALYGASQVIYTFAEVGQPAVFAECGAMNIFFLMKRSADSSECELVTPPLDGTILPGVTRDSILSLARQWGDCVVSERSVTLDEVQQASHEQRLLEVFGSGTACIVQPVGELVRANGQVMKTAAAQGQMSMHGDEGPGRRASFAERLQQEILDIQYGKRPNHPWSVPVE